MILHFNIPTFIENSTISAHPNLESKASTEDY
jgi:hypothetical protein